ncbi:TonB-dependent receptor plug domain-containing protein [Desulfobulbus elongatus]|uniref:TonB-dependent receptor plug domain-containing protein n=1 Tax=Desulfobulbus elongatus TaxID=53332 RepID=UPI000684A072|nr:TonB-dependent receptor [Desulfobulbus elongatus]
MRRTHPCVRPGRCPARLRSRVPAWCRATWLALCCGCLLPLPRIALADHDHAPQANASESTVLETVVVTADHVRDYAENNPAMVEVLGRREIDRRNMRSVEEALASMAGVEVKQSAGVGSRIAIRGSGKSGGVLVLLNGRPLNSSQYGSVDLASIPVETIESITVFKPPVPVWLGAGASDGAISIVTRGLAGTKEKGRQVTKVRTAAGSYGALEANASSQMPLAAGTAMATAAGKHRDGKRTNNDLDSGSLLLHWDGDLADNRKVEIDGRYFSSESGSPGPLDNPTPDARQSYEKASFDGRLSGLAGANGDYGLNLYGDSVEVEDTSQSGLVSTLDDARIGLKGEYNWNDDADRWALRASSLVENDDLDHTLSGSHSRMTAGFGVQADRKWQDWLVTAGARGDRITGFGFNPGLSGGLRHVLGEGWSLKANLGHSVNIPTFGQLYQPSHGSIDQTRGNPDLDKEKILAADAGLEYAWSTARSIQLTAFRSETDDPILYQRGADLIYRPVNGGSAWRHGLEANWKYGFTEDLSLEANLIVQDSEVEETGRELTYTPHLKAKLTLQRTLPGTGTRLETTLRYSGEQYTEMENRAAQQLDDYLTVDCKAIQPFKLAGLNAEWFLNVDNLFDTGYSIHYGYPDEGLRFLTGLNLSF